MLKHAKFTISLAAALTIGTAALAATPLDIKFAGALEFAEGGTLFVGDNHNGAIYAFEIPEEANEQQIMPSSIANIDAKIAELLGVNAGAIEINDIAAHSISNDIYISVTRIGNLASQPAIVTVSQDQQLALLDIDALPFQRQELTANPEGESTFGVRGMGPYPPLPRDIAKGDIPLNTLAIMDIEYYEGELFSPVLRMTTSSPPSAASLTRSTVRKALPTSRCITSPMTNMKAARRSGPCQCRRLTESHSWSPPIPAARLSLSRWTRSPTALKFLPGR